MTQEQKTYLQKMSGINKFVKHKLKGARGSEVVGKVIDEVYVMVNDYKHLIQRIELVEGMFSDCSVHAYRTGYYTYDANKKRVVWGQYTQFVTQMQYKELLEKAKEKGRDIF